LAPQSFVEAVKPDSVGPFGGLEYCGDVTMGQIGVVAQRKPLPVSRAQQPAHRRTVHPFQRRLAWVLQLLLVWQIAGRQARGARAMQSQRFGLGDAGDPAVRALVGAAGVAATPRAQQGALGSIVGVGGLKSQAPRGARGMSATITDSARGAYARRLRRATASPPTTATSCGSAPASVD